MLEYGTDVNTLGGYSVWVTGSVTVRTGDAAAARTAASTLSAVQTVLGMVVGSD